MAERRCTTGAHNVPCCINQAEGMATSKQRSTLVKSFADQDDAQFFRVVLQVAAAEARKRHSNVARELRDWTDEARQRKPVIERTPGPVMLGLPKGELTGLLRCHYPGIRLQDLVLAGPLRTSLDRLLKEHRQAHDLRAHGLRPRRKLLLAGPPGTGKTMTAHAIAGELRVPLLVVRLDTLIARFLGETAAKLRLVFDAMEETPGVHRFDAFDALGARRATLNDVGEIRRVLNSFLPFIEADDSDRVVLAATNHVERLDRALFRRFDSVLQYERPDEALALQMLKMSLASFPTKSADFEQAARGASGLAQADILGACEEPDTRPDDARPGPCFTARRPQGAGGHARLPEEGSRHRRQRIHRHGRGRPPSGLRPREPGRPPRQEEDDAADGPIYIPCFGAREGSERAYVMRVRSGYRKRVGRLRCSWTSGSSTSSRGFTGVKRHLMCPPSAPRTWIPRGRSARAVGLHQGGQAGTPLGGLHQGGSIKGVRPEPLWSGPTPSWARQPLESGFVSDSGPPPKISHRDWSTSAFDEGRKDRKHRFPHATPARRPSPQLSLGQSARGIFPVGPIGRAKPPTPPNLAPPLRPVCPSTPPFKRHLM